MAELSHAVRVARLYRGALRASLNWAVDREIWAEYATGLRARFEEARGLSQAQGAVRAEGRSGGGHCTAAAALTVAAAGAGRCVSVLDTALSDALIRVLQLARRWHSPLRRNRVQGASAGGHGRRAPRRGE